MATTTPNYAVDYEDKRLTNIKSEEQTQLEQNAQMYDGMIQGVDEQYKGIADTIQSNADKLAQTQQENTDFQVQQIEQQKEQAQKDYTKEQSGAYVDFQKQSNQYGVNAEQMAMQGLAGSGYSESSKVAMYNQYQNRVAVARETLSKVIMNYDNNIQQAILQNNSTIAQIQSEASLKQAEILLEGFNYNNTLLEKQAEKELQIKSMYQSNYMDMLDQINKENALAEQVRQAEIEQANKDRDYQLQLRAMEIAEAEDKRNAEMYEIAKQNTVSGGQSKTGSAGSAVAKGVINKQAGTQTPTAQTNSSVYGNTSKTTSKNDYYFDNGYQPRYVNDTKLDKSGMTTNILPQDLGIPTGQNIWSANGKYYAWNGKTKQYIDVTSDLTFSNGYQPKYMVVNGKAQELNSAGTIKKLLGSYGKLKTSQNVWQAGRTGKYYVWDGSTKKYKDVTKDVYRHVYGS